jgi:membrane protease YdiL (CAAX protease family)
MTDPSEAPSGTGLDAPVPVEIAPAPADARIRFADRVRAAFEVFLCSGIPTQIFVSGLLMLVGVRPLHGTTFDATWVTVVTLGDTVLLLLLTTLLIRKHGESPRRVFLGESPPWLEAVFGLLLIVPLLMIVALVMLALQSTAPSLHNVAENPFSEMLKSPREAVVFSVVALVGGPVREEIQRAFLLTRFERYLGGPAVGLVVTSVAFGAGHWVQGWDASLAIGVLGVAWGWIYLRRRSVVASMVSHAGFNSLEVLRFLFVGVSGV